MSCTIPRLRELFNTDAIEAELNTVHRDPRDLNDATQFWRPLRVWSGLVLHLVDHDPATLRRQLAELERMVPDDPRIAWFTARVKERL